MISGQGPTAQTASDCPVFSRIKPGHKGVRSQILGTGCIYPPATRTLAGQLTSARRHLEGLHSGRQHELGDRVQGSEDRQQTAANRPHQLELPRVAQSVHLFPLADRGGCLPQ